MTWYAWLALIAVAAVWLAMIFRQARRRSLQEIAGFSERPRQNDEDFLAELDIAPGSPEAVVACQLRSLIAELGQVPADTIHASTRFYPDLEKLPYYDSPDSLDVLIRIEDTFDVRIPDATFHELMKAMEQGCVRDFVLGWVRYFQTASGVRSA